MDYKFKIMKTQSKDALIIRINSSLENLKSDVDKAYHESQIEACKRTIKGHEEYIQELMESKRPDEESKSVTEDGSE